MHFSADTFASRGTALIRVLREVSAYIGGGKSAGLGAGTLRASVQDRQTTTRIPVVLQRGLVAAPHPAQLCFLQEDSRCETQHVCGKAAGAKAAKGKQQQHSTNVQGDRARRTHPAPAGGWRDSRTAPTGPPKHCRCRRRKEAFMVCGAAVPALEKAPFLCGCVNK